MGLGGRRAYLLRSGSAKQGGEDGELGKHFINYRKGLSEQLEILVEDLVLRGR